MYVISFFDDGTKYPVHKPRRMYAFRRAEKEILSPKRWAKFLNLWYETDLSSDTAHLMHLSSARDMDVPQNKWPKLLPMVQAAMNRKKRASRGNRSPIELTTGIQPRTVADMIYRGDKVVDIVDEKASRRTGKKPAPARYQQYRWVIL